MAADRAAALYGSGASSPKRWRDIWSAGHSVSGVDGVPDVAQLIEKTREEYVCARNLR